MPTTPPARLRLRREQRVRAGGEFVRLKTSGRRQVNGCLIFNWEPASARPDAISRAGFVTSKAVGNAVARNRARRLLREAFRRHQHDLARPVTAILVARRSIVGRTYDQVEADYLQALRQARLLTPSPAPVPPPSSSE